MKIFLIFLLMSFSCHLWAQSCLSSITNTSPDTNFTDNGDGTVIDSTTGLMWMKCSIGQTFDAINNTCTGEATVMTWQEALQSTYAFEFADLTSWRLPNVKELASITERSCVRPAINATFFPSTPPDDFWTSTPSLVDLNSSWVVAFFNSSNALKDKNNFVFVRLVRFAE
ncbi:MAG: DUF1566 domain-containing protein [Aestuariibacter sp.]